MHQYVLFKPILKKKLYNGIMMSSNGIIKTLMVIINTTLWPLNLILDNAYAVSYTHLDVYKRQQLVTSFVVGIAMGTTILLGRRIGEGNPEEAGKIIGASIILFSIIGVCITVIMEVFAIPIAQIMQTPTEAFSATVEYLRICSGGSLFIVADVYKRQSSL